MLTCLGIKLKTEIHYTTFISVQILKQLGILHLPTGYRRKTVYHRLNNVQRWQYRIININQTWLISFNWMESLSESGTITSILCEISQLWLAIVQWLSATTVASAHPDSKLEQTFCSVYQPLVPMNKYGWIKFMLFWGILHHQNNWYWDEQKSFNGLSCTLICSQLTIQCV